MSELKIVTPDECTISDDTKRDLVDDINRTLTSGTRLYNAARAHVGFIRELATASGWSVSHRPDDRGNVIQLLFTTSEDRVESAAASSYDFPIMRPYTYVDLTQRWVGASPR